MAQRADNIAGGSSPWWRKAWRLINNKTAAVCHDYPSPDTKDEPFLRSTLRFLVTVIAVLAAFGAVIYVYETSVGWRIVRHWSSTQYLLTLPTSQPNDPHLQCPCYKPAIPWPYFVGFFWINQTQNQSGSWDRVQITNYTQFCDPLIADNGSSGVWREGCYAMGQSLTAFSNITKQTTVTTNTVTAPSVLAQMIATGMQNIVNDIMVDYSSLSTSDSADWVQLLKVKQFYIHAAFRFGDSTRWMGDENATNAAYWRYFKGLDYTIPPKGGLTKPFDLTGKRALVVEMDWAAYLNKCNPPYCDEVRINNLPQRFLEAVISVGGFGAVMIVVLQSIVWPCIRHINHWS